MGPTLLKIVEQEYVRADSAPQNHYYLVTIVHTYIQILKFVVPASDSKKIVANYYSKKFSIILPL